MGQQSYPLNNRGKKIDQYKMNRALGTDETINLAFISLVSEGKERVGLKNNILNGGKSSQVKI